MLTSSIFFIECEKSSFWVCFRYFVFVIDESIDWLINTELSIAAAHCAIPDGPAGVAPTAREERSDPPSEIAADFGEIAGRGLRRAPWAERFMYFYFLSSVWCTENTDENGRGWSRGVGKKMKRPPLFLGF